jgi:23S rRNA (guanosine2251-2'-O)-methyltransferase
VRRSPGAGRVGPEAGPARKGPKGLGGDQVEGRQAVRELLVAGRRRVKEVLLANDLEPAPILDDIVELAEARRVPVRHIGRGKLETLTATSASQGVLARAQQLPEHELEELARRRRPSPAFLLALDGVTDPGNLGAVLRSAEGAGVTGVVLPRHRAVHVTPAVTKAAAGAVEYVPMALVGGLPAALAKLDELGVWVVGLDADAERPIYELPVGDERVCLVLGAEGAGLSRLVRQRCHAVARVPVTGQLNSLNVAAAGAVACFAVARARAERADAASADAAAPPTAP